MTSLARVILLLEAIVTDVKKYFPDRTGYKNISLFVPRWIDENQMSGGIAIFIIPFRIFVSLLKLNYSLTKVIKTNVYRKKHKSRKKKKYKYMLI